jgi:replicative DNA helicase
MSTPIEVTNSIEPPHNREAEEACLGGVLINPDSYSDVVELLTPKDFFIHRHRMILEAMNLVVAEGSVIDIITVNDALTRLGYDVGAGYLTALINQCPNSTLVAEYAKKVEHFSLRRAMVKKANQMAQVAYDLALTNEELEDKADDILNTLPASSKVTGINACDVAENLKEEIHNDTPTCIPTYISTEDNTFGGYEKKKLTIQIGDTSLGKTALYVQSAEAANFAGHKVLYITLEAGVSDVVMRRVLTRCKVPIATYRSRTMIGVQKEKLEQALVEYQTNHKNLTIDEKAYSLREIEKSIRTTRPELVIVDDLSNVSDGVSGNSTTENLIYICKQLKRMAKKHNCAMVVLHHPSNDESKRVSANTEMNTRPNFEAIAWAGDIRKLADVLLWLVADVKADPNSDKIKIYQWLMKDRMGARYVCIPLEFDKSNQWFTTLPMPRPASKVTLQNMFERNNDETEN